MDAILQTLLSWQFVLFSLAVTALIYFVRTTAEYVVANWKPAAKQSKLWTDLLLPLLPVIVGPLTAVLVKTFPYPSGLTTTGSRFLFGLVAGLISGLLYRVVKSLLFSKLQSLKDIGGAESEKPQDTIVKQ